MKLWILKHIIGIGGPLLTLLVIPYFLVMSGLLAGGVIGPPSGLMFFIPAIVALFGIMVSPHLSQRIPRKLVGRKLEGTEDKDYIVVNQRTGQIPSPGLNSRPLSFLPLSTSITPSPIRITEERFQQEYPVECELSTKYKGEDITLLVLVEVQRDKGTGLFDLTLDFSREKELLRALKVASEQKLGEAFSQIEVTGEKLKDYRFLQQRIKEVGTGLEGPPYHIEKLKVDLDSVVAR